MNKKYTGSFYTPEKLINFMLKHIKFEEIKTILEPSVGDGRFIDNILKISNDLDITCIDLIGSKIEKLKTKYQESLNIDYINSDYIEYSLKNNKKIDLIIGNPPYLEKKKLLEKHIELSNNLLDSLNLDKKMYKNIWVMFLVASIEQLSKNGKIFFVLPFEFLQVNYAKILRNYLEKIFNIIEITTFKEKVFSEVEQEVCLVYLEKKEVTPYIKYKIYDTLDSLIPSLNVNIERNKPLEKWSNAILEDEEIELLNSAKKKYLTLENIGRISPGIVTGANAYFILNKEEILKYKAQNNVIPIVSQSRYLQETLNLSEVYFQKLVEKNLSVYMLKLEDNNIEKFSKELKEYLNSGIDQKINKRYKCSKRNLWYNVPLIEKGNLLFFKRFHEIPKLVTNEANVYTTDVCYNIRLLDKYERDSIWFCFYNSLTIALCEYNGRFYGGGVGELTPKEFKSLVVPYQKIKKVHIKKLKRLFKEKKEFNQILDYVDSIVFKDLENEEFLEKIKKIRKKYLLRRLKK